jgi:hypothetical protein
MSLTEIIIKLNVKLSLWSAIKLRISGVKNIETSEIKYNKETKTYSKPKLLPPVKKEDKPK